MEARFRSACEEDRFLLIHASRRLHELRGDFEPLPLIQVLKGTLQNAQVLATHLVSGCGVAALASSSSTSTPAAPADVAHVRFTQVLVKLLYGGKPFAAPEDWADALIVELHFVRARGGSHHAAAAAAAAAAGGNGRRPPNHGAALYPVAVWSVARSAPA